MKYFYPFIVALMFLSFIIYGLWNSEQQQQKEIIQSSQTALNDLQDSIRALQNNVATLQDSVKNVLAKNPDLDLQMQVNNMREKVDTYQKFVSDITNNLHEDMDDWLVILSIVITVIVALLGVVVPLIINYRNEKHLEKMLEDSKKESNNAATQAKEAQNAIEDAQNNLHDIQSKVQEATDQATIATAKAEYARNALVENINKVKEAVKKVEKTEKSADSAAKKAKAIQLFIQAMQESDDNRAIILYDQCIGEEKDFAEAYNNRGYLKYRNGIRGAKEDFTDAIAKKNNYSEAYNNRGIIYFENNKYYEAKEDFEHAGNYADSYLNLGLLKYKLNEKGVEDLFDKAIKQNPYFAEAYYIRGLFYYENPDWEEYAIKDIIKAKDLKANVVEAYPHRNLLDKNMKVLDNSINGVEYSKDMTKLIRVPAEKQTINIISSVNEISSRAFFGCQEINSITIPQSVIKIGHYAFYNCCKLISIVIPKSVSCIEEWTFSNCSELKHIQFLGNIVKIKSHAFMNCTKLCSIEIPIYLSKIEEWSFSGCTELTSIKIPYNVTEIEKYAFSRCSNLSSLYISGSVSRIGEYAFSNCDKLSSIYLGQKEPVDFSTGFKNLNFFDITLYVPKGSIEAYRKDPFYSQFKEVKEEQITTQASSHE